MDARTWTLVLNTILLVAGTCAISLPLGTFLAWLLVRTDMPGRRAGRFLLALMLFVPLYLQAAAWQAGFGLQGWFTLATGSPALLVGWAGAVWVHAVAAVPWVVLITGVGLHLLEPELEEAALLDGSSRQVLLRVTLRGALPAVGLAGLWTAIVVAGEMTVTDLFMVRTYAEELYTRTAIGPQPGDGPLAMGPGILLTVLLVTAGVLLCAKISPGNRPPGLRTAWVYRLGRGRLAWTLVFSAFLVILIGVPLANLCMKAGLVVTQTAVGRVRTWSALKCLSIIAESPIRYRMEFGWTFLVGGLAATSAVLFGTCLAWSARRGGSKAVPALLITSVCLALPGPIVGLALIRLLNRPEIPGLVFLYDRSILAPWLGQTIRCLVPATLVMWHALRTTSEQTLEAAAVDGAGPIRRFWAIVLPSRMMAVTVAWIVALAVAIGELAVSLLVVPPRVATLPVRIFGLLHAGVEDQVAGICLALIGLFAGIAAVVTWLVGRWRRRSNRE